MDKVSKGLAPLCATILGVLTFVGWLPRWTAITMIVSGLLALVASRVSLYFSPILAAIIVTFWILTGTGLMAAVTAFLLWLTLHIPQLFPTLPAETLKEVSAALTGAFTTFAGVMITKEMEEGGGFFWPGTQFKKGLSAVFTKPPRTPVANSIKWQAVYNDRVHGDGPRGWGFRARLRRATILTTP